MLQPPQKGYELLDPAEDVEEDAVQLLSELAVPAEPAEKQEPESGKIEKQSSVHWTEEQLQAAEQAEQLASAPA